MRIKKDLKTFGEIVREYKIESIIILLVGVICLLGFEYVDGKSLMAYSIELWDALFSGRFLDLPQLYLENVRQAPHGGIGINGTVLALLPWAIWNLPIWLTHTFTKMSDVLTPLCIIWAKLFLYVCAAAIGMQCYEIVNRVTGNKKNARLAAVLFWGSSTLFISIGYSMQDEVVYIFTMLLALRAFLGEKKRQCVAWLAVTTFLAPFMMLITLIIILFMEKRIWAIVADCLIMIAPYAIIGKLLPSISEGQDNYLEWFFSRTTFSTGISTLSIFCICLVAIYALAYFKIYNNNEERNLALLYYLATATSLMCILSWLHFYRYIICVAFLVIAIFADNLRDRSITNASIVFLTAFEACRLVGAIFWDSNFLAPGYVSRLAEKFVDRGLPSTVELFKAIFNISDGTISLLSMLMLSIAVAMLILLLGFLRVKENNVTQMVKNDRILTKIYVCIPLVVYIGFFLFTSRVIYVSTEINGNSTLAQPITNDVMFETSCDFNVGRILSLSIQPVTWGRTYPEDLKLCLNVIDDSDNSVVGECQVLANDLPDNSEYKFDISDVRMQKNHQYAITLFSEGTMESEDDYIYLLRSEDNSDTSKLALSIQSLSEGIEHSANYNVISNMLATK